MAGGFVSGFLATTLGTLLLRPFLPRLAELALAALVLALIALHELGVIRLRLPQNARQVPQSIVEDGPRYGPLQFGFEMGTGVRTYMTSGLPHALAAALLLLAGWLPAMAAGASFGAARAWMTLSRNWHPDVDAWDDALRGRERWIRVALTVAAGAMLAVIVHIGLRH